MMRFRFVLAGVFAVALNAPAVEAQSTFAESPIPALDSMAASRPAHATADTTRPGPRLESAIVGARRVGLEADSLAGASVAQQGGRFGRPETFMIVGGAAFVAGLLIGDDAGTVVMVGGALVGLYGLYLYLQTQ